MTAVERDPETGEFKRLLVFEFYGCFFHKCTVHAHPPDEPHPMRKDKGRPLKWGEIFELDEQRLKVLQVEFGDVEIIYECEFERDFIEPGGKNHQRWEQYLKTFPDRQMLDKKPRSESEILEMVGSTRPAMSYIY